MHTRALVFGTLCLLCAAVPAAFAADPVPISGTLLVSGWDDGGTKVQVIEGTSDNIQPAPGVLYLGEISPDGAHIAYTELSSEPGVDWSTSGRILKADRDGSNAVDLTIEAGIDGVNCFSRWSPDGSRIAFQHSDTIPGLMPCDSGFHVWIMNADGTGAYRVTAPGYSPTRVPSWSPNGYTFVCEADDLGSIVINADGSNASVLPNVGAAPVWSNDGTKIASTPFAPGQSGGQEGVWRRLVVTDSDGSNPQVLVERFVSDAEAAAHLVHLGVEPTDFEIAGVQWNVGPVHPQWSPTGDRLAVIGAFPFDPQGVRCEYQREVWAYNLSTGQLEQVTSNSWCESLMSWRGNNTYPEYPEVTVETASVSFESVTDPGLTTLVLEIAPPAVPDAYQVAGPCYDVSTTAGYTGLPTIAMAYEDGDIDPQSQSDLCILRYDSGTETWEDVTSATDTDADVVQASTDAFSLFGLFLPLPTAHFPDVPATGLGPAGLHPYWAFWEIEAAYQAGVVAGYSDGTYQPTATVTRDQMAVYIARSICTPTGDAGLVDYVPPTTPSFSDVPTDFWCYKYIEYAVEHTVVGGYEDGTYQPGLRLDRGQMAVFIARAMAGDDQSVPDPTGDPSFPDVPADFWSYRHIEYIAGEGVAGGYFDGLYHPENPVDRAQMAVFICRAFQLT